ncbi:hypothetical protein Vafri_9090 [Volvox africanus]|uniref:Uncharacterized protein n=1 Tax=Volvox africanus TaxID=51714 RepID=A0A8J4B808_9CHLO|nr:hypothetical protein Vafri_9090 [Volvox africanus]
MSGLAELESARRRRLQQAYTDLRPLDKGNDDERPGRGSAAAGGACPPSHLAGVHSGRSGHGAGAAEAVTAAVAAVPPVAAAQFNPFNCDTDDADVALPSDVELALISVKSDLRSHPGSADLPPMALRSHLSCLLADRLTVERQLDEQRRANCVRVFKLPTGTPALTCHRQQLGLFLRREVIGRPGNE